MGSNPTPSAIPTLNVMKRFSADPQSLTEIPGVGRSIARDLHDIGILSVADLKGKNAELLYELSNQHACVKQDRCLLYVFRTAVYFADGGRDAEKLKWWNWKDGK